MVKVALRGVAEVLAETVYITVELPTPAIGDVIEIQEGGAPMLHVASDGLAVNVRLLWPPAAAKLADDGIVENDGVAPA